MRTKLFLSCVLFFVLQFSGFAQRNNDPANYTKLWSMIDSLDQKGLQRSAYKISLEIFQKAKAEKNSSQLVKAMLHRLKFQDYTEEDALLKNIETLEQETKTSQFPERLILHSILAEMYWRYYENNRYRFLERSQTRGLSEEDPANWDLYKIVEVCVNHYSSSLSENSLSRKVPVENFETILLDGDSVKTRNLRPTLYDFLSHRALDFYMNTETGLTRPAESFKLNDPGFFAGAAEFSVLRIQNKDTSDFKYRACKLFQNLLSFHLNDSDPSALIDLDMKRLGFLRNSMNLPEVDSLYEMSLLSLAGKYSTNSLVAETLYEVAAIYEQRGNQYNQELPLEHKWDLHTALQYCQKIISTYPDSRGALLAQNLILRLNEPYLSFQVEDVNPMGRVFRARVEYKNVNKLFCRVVAHKSGLPKMQWMHGNELLQNLMKDPVLRSWTVELPNDSDLHAHSVEIIIPSFDFGSYILLISDQEEYVEAKSNHTYASFQISDMSMISRIMDDGAYEFYVLDRITGNPMSKVFAELKTQIYNQSTGSYDTLIVGNYTSDKNGRFEVNAPENQGRNFSVKLRSGDDVLFFDEGFYQNRFINREKRVQEQTTFFTDRSIYRPGQLIYFKAILLQIENEIPKILANHSTTVQFFDVNGQLISEQKLSTNEFGTINGTFTAPQNVLNGNLTIRNASGQTYISLEEYKRPRFEVNFSPVKGSYKVGERVDVSGFAKTFSGLAVDAASVKYHVSRSASFPPWCYWYKGFFPITGRQEIADGEITTDANGEFSFSFVAQADEQSNKEFQPLFRFEVFVDVTDLNGETRSQQTTVNVAYTSMELITDFPESYDLNNKEPLKVVARNFSGSNVLAKVSLSIYKIKEPERLMRSRPWSGSDKKLYSKEEFIKNFPLDIYDNEDDFTKWEKESTIWSTTLNTMSDSTLLLKSEEWAPGFYLLEGSAIDSFGEKVKLLHYFSAYKTDSKLPCRNELSWIRVLKDDAKPGQKNKILISSAARNVYVSVSVSNRNKIVSQEWIRFNNEQKIIEIPVTEEYRGNFSVQVFMVKEGRIFIEEILMKVPWDNKTLSIEYETFRSVLEPGKKEEWRLKFKDSNGKGLEAELLASMYDASLDIFRGHQWKKSFYSTYRAYSRIRNHGFSLQNSLFYTSRVFDPEFVQSRIYDQLNWFGYNVFDYNIGGQPYKSNAVFLSAESDAVQIQGERAKLIEHVSAAMAAESPSPQEELKFKEDKMEEVPISIRTNLQETAFFYPNLTITQDSTYHISFNTPEALTRWKLQVFAHSKDLKYVFDEREVITQKELMVIPNLPRFFRAGDTLNVSTKINSLKDGVQNGVASLHILDAFTMRACDSLFQNNIANKNFSVSKELSTNVSWSLIVPENTSAVKIILTAKAGNFSDGEEHMIPVFSNRQLVTESLPIWTRGEESKEYEMKKLTQNKSKTLKHERLKLEYTSNPIWTVVQALPYLMEYPQPCSEQIFSRYYANSIAKYISNSSPRIKSIFENWKALSPESFLSNLEKNQDLKSVLLTETPWVLDAKDEKERKERIALLFDLNKMSNEQSAALAKLKKQQMPGGAWAWFEGMPENRYITQHIVSGLLQLIHLDVLTETEIFEIKPMISSALNYLDRQIADDYQKLILHKAKDSSYVPSALQVQYLYLRSFNEARKVSNLALEAYTFYFDQSGKYWLKHKEYMQAMIALAHFRSNDLNVSTDILNSLKDNALRSEEMGMYWKNITGGYYWTDAAIEAQSTLIECFSEILQDAHSVDEMKIWLLRQKQTHSWKSTKATVAACYALMLRGTDWIESDNIVRLTIGDEIIQSNDPALGQESGTGNFNLTWDAAEVRENMGKIQLSTMSVSDTNVSGISWGALYWQYFEDLDKITDANSGALMLKKNLFVERPGVTGPVLQKINSQTEVKVGDKIIVRIVLVNDRSMEFLHLKDLRASGLEPVNVLSGYKWQDGFGYYESTGDASTNFFIAYLPKGTYVFEYPLRAAQIGKYSTGITNIQNMYAPEFSAHSFGERIQILGK